MSKRNNKKQHKAVVVNAPQPVIAPKTFGFEEMLNELEAIVCDAERHQEEEHAA